MKKSLSIEEFLETRPDITPEMLEEGRLLVEAKIKGYELQQARKACGMTQKESPPRWASARSASPTWRTAASTSCRWRRCGATSPAWAAPSRSRPNFPVSR